MPERAHGLGNHLQSSAAGSTGHRNCEISRHLHRTPEPRRLRHLASLAPLQREALIPVGRLKEACIRPADIAHLPNTPNIWPSRLINTSENKSRYHHDTEPTLEKYSTTKKKKKKNKQQQLSPTCVPVFILTCPNCWEFGHIKATASEGVSPEPTQKCSQLPILEKSPWPLKAPQGTAICLHPSRHLPPVTKSGVRAQTPECKHFNQLSMAHTVTVLNSTQGMFIQDPSTALGCTGQWGHRCFLHFSTLYCQMLSHTGPLPSAPATWTQGTGLPVRRLWRVMLCRGALKTTPGTHNQKAQTSTATQGSLSPFLQWKIRKPRGEDSETRGTTQTKAAGALCCGTATFIRTAGLQRRVPTSSAPSCSIVTLHLLTGLPWQWTWAAAAVAPAARWPSSEWRAERPPGTPHTALFLGSWCPSSPRCERHKKASRKTQTGRWGPTRGPETQTPSVGLPWAGGKTEPRSQSGEWGVWTPQRWTGPHRQYHTAPDHPATGPGVTGWRRWG